MPSPDDMLAWKDIATAGAVIMSGGVAFIVKQFTARLDKHEQEDRETFKAIFESQKELAKQVSAGQLALSEQLGSGLRDISEKLSGTHIQLLERISDVQQGKDKQ